MKYINHNLNEAHAFARDIAEQVREKMSSLPASQEELAHSLVHDVTRKNTDDKTTSEKQSHGNAMVLALIGELGSGKTTFAQGFAKSLGVQQTLKSPTFTLMHQYAIPDSKIRNSKFEIRNLSLWHLDLFRLEKMKDFYNLDLASVFSDSHNIVLIEWPEKALSMFPKEHVELRFTHKGQDKRGVTVKWPPSLR